MSPLKSNKYAFLLGISNYDNFDSYEFPDKVINKFHDLLMETGQYGPNSIICLRTDGEKEFQPIINKIRAKFKYFINEVLKKDKKCQIIIYFLCHGGSFNNKNFIFPSDVEPYDIEGTSIEINWFIDQIEPLGDNWDVLLIIDACRIEMKEGLSLRKFEGFTEDIMDRSCPAGINVLWACAPGDSSVVAKEKNTKERFSVFSRALLNGLTKDLKGPVSNEKLSEYMIDEVERNALEYKVHVQKPWLKVDVLELGKKKEFFICEGEDFKIKEEIKLRRRCDFLVKSAKEAIVERDFEEAWDYLEAANPICIEILHDSNLLKEIRKLRRIIRSRKKQDPEIFLEESEIVPYRNTQSMFLCYSYPDAELVRSFSEVYRSLGLEINFIEDITDKWEEQVKWLIERSDIFVLFWSTSAMQSKYVAAEYKYALKIAEQKGERFIRPCYWETPMPPLPEELKHIHFHKLRVETLPDFTRLKRNDVEIKGKEIKDKNLTKYEKNMVFTKPIFDDNNIPSGVSLLLSSSRNQNSWSFKKEGRKNSVFSYALLKGLNKLSRPITFGNLVNFIKSEVSKIQAKHDLPFQRPTSQSSIETFNKIIIGHQGTKHKWAFLIGINEYKDTSLKNLESSERDVLELREILYNSDEYKNESIKTLIGSQATGNNIRAELLMLLDQIQPRDTLIFYYQGHGGTIEDKQYIFPYDTNFKIRELLKVNSIPIDWFIDEMKQHDSHLWNAFFIIDSGQSSIMTY